MRMENRCPLVGVGVFLTRTRANPDTGFTEIAVLAGKRKRGHGEGSWSLPGGHVEWMEDPEDAVKREVLEETGLVVTGKPFPLMFLSVRCPERNHHYITLYYEVSHFEGEVKNPEPERCEGWGWFVPEKIPEPRFDALDDAILCFQNHLGGTPL